MTLAFIQKRNAKIARLVEPGDRVSYGGRELIAEAEPGWEDSEFALVDCTVTDPPFDPGTEVKEGPVDVVTPKTWEPCSRTWLVRPMTVEEKTAHDVIEEENAAREALFKALFNHENRIRVFEGKSQIAKEQFITVLKGIT